MIEFRKTKRWNSILKEKCKLMESNDFFEEQQENREYFKESELMELLRRELDEETLDECKHALLDYTNEVARYWYQIGFDIAKEMREEVEETYQSFKHKGAKNAP